MSRSNLGGTRRNPTDLSPLIMVGAVGAGLYLFNRAIGQQAQAIGGAIAATGPGLGGAAASTGQGVGGALAATGQGVGGALGATFGGIGGAIGSFFSGVGATVRASVPFGGADPRTGAASNTGANQFNINTGQSGATLSLSQGTMTAQVGFGHVGQGGTFVCILWGQYGSSGPVQIAQQTFSANNDGSWTGYNVQLSAPSPFGGGMLAWADIRGQGGELYTQAAIPVTAGA